MDPLASPQPQPKPKPSDHSPLFDPAVWLYNPISRTAMARADVKPCGTCGHPIFVWVANGPGYWCHRCYCEVCYATPRYRCPRPGDVVYMRLDTRTLVQTQLLAEPPFSA